MAWLYAMTKQVSEVVMDVKNIFDKILDQHSESYIASTVNNLNPSIVADVSTVNSQISTLQSIKDAIDNARQDSPINLQSAEDSVAAALQSLQEKQQDLDNAGTIDNSLDIKAQEISVQQRENTLADAMDKLSNYTIRAAYDGLIAELNVSKGDTVSSGTVVATLITKQKIIEVSLNEVDVAMVSDGQKVTLTFDAITDLEMTGTVAEIDMLGTVSQGVVSYNVKITLDTQDNRIKPGMSASASIITNIKQDILMVPNGAIKTSGEVSYVEVVAGIDAATLTSTVTPTEQTVEVGLSNDDNTEIISGVDEGEMVVVKTVIGGATSSTATKSSGFNLLGGGRPPG